MIWYYIVGKSCTICQVSFWNCGNHGINMDNPSSTGWRIFSIRSFRFLWVTPVVEAFKKGVDADDARRKREDAAVQLRKATRDEVGWTITSNWYLMVRWCGKQWSHQSANSNFRFRKSLDKQQNIEIRMTIIKLIINDQYWDDEIQHDTTTIKYPLVISNITMENHNF